MDPARRRYTEREYLALERPSPTKHELADGVIVAMAGATPEHNLVCSNLTAELVTKLRDKQCFVLPSDQRVHVRATGLFTYPDVTVVCGKPEYHPEDAATILNPLLIVEVLSESTADYDRGKKFIHYQSIPSFVDYLLVATDGRRIDHFHRIGSGQWTLTVYDAADSRIEIASLGITVALGDVYAKVDQLRPTSLSG